MLTTGFVMRATASGNDGLPAAGGAASERPEFKPRQLAASTTATGNADRRQAKAMTQAKKQERRQWSAAGVLTATAVGE
jgi:hypothetical protein